MIFPLIFAWLFLALPGQAATINVVGCNGSADHSKVQTAVDSATDGDTVQIPSGTCTFTGSVTWSNKAIIVQGAGIGVTNITSNSQAAFDVTVTTEAGFRLTAMTINANALNSEGAIEIDGQTMTGEIASRFRVDHILLNIDNGTGPRMMFVHGPVYGLIDHLTFDYNGGDTVNGISVYANMTSDTSYGGSTQNGSYACNNFAIDLGGSTAVYVEDSTFTHAWGTGNSGGINDLNYCARMVFRYNTVTGPWHLQTHSTRGTDRGGIRSEYYNNSFNGNNDGLYTGPMVLRGGTGVIFNNTMLNMANCWWCQQPKALLTDFQRVPNTGCTVSSPPLNTVTGSNPADGRIEANGWPALDQPGWVGPQAAQTNVPIYLWNNGAQVGCSTGGACNGDWNDIYLNCEGDGNVGAKMEDFVKTTVHSNGAKDYCSGTTSMPGSCGTHTNTYVPYTYPHPLQGGADTTPPSVPTGVTIGLLQGER